MVQFDAGAGSIQTLRPRSSPRAQIEKSTHIGAIRVLAIEQGGHWKKLESFLVPASKNSRTLT